MGVGRPTIAIYLGPPFYVTFGSLFYMHSLLVMTESSLLPE